VAQAESGIGEAAQQEFRLAVAVQVGRENFVDGARVPVLVEQRPRTRVAGSGTVASTPLASGPASQRSRSSAYAYGCERSPVTKRWIGIGRFLSHRCAVRTSTLR
jgi:hypothetical protein